MALELGSVCKRVTAQGAAEVVFVLLVAILNVFFQRGKAFISSVTVRTGEQLGKCIWCSVFIMPAGLRRALPLVILGCLGVDDCSVLLLQELFNVRIMVLFIFCI